MQPSSSWPSRTETPPDHLASGEKKPLGPQSCFVALLPLSHNPQGPGVPPPFWLPSTPSSFPRFGLTLLADSLHQSASQLDLVMLPAVSLTPLHACLSRSNHVNQPHGPASAIFMMQRTTSIHTGIQGLTHKLHRVLPLPLLHDILRSWSTSVCSCFPHTCDQRPLVHNHFKGLTHQPHRFLLLPSLHENTFVASVHSQFQRLTDQPHQSMHFTRFEHASVFMPLPSHIFMMAPVTAT